MKKLLWFVFLLAAVIPAGAAGQKIAYEIEGKGFEGYLQIPSPEAPLILLIHDWDGLTEYEIKRADMLAALGYAVFAADLFGTGIRPVEMEERRRLTDELYKDRGRMRTLLTGALETARSKGANVKNAIAMGYCFGGAVALEFARSGANLKGFVAFHGVLSTPEGQDYSKVMGKLLILHGAADEYVTMEQFADLAKALEAAHKPHEMIAYGGAPHAFTVFGSSAYREDADRNSWTRFTEFLDATLRH